MQSSYDQMIASLTKTVSRVACFSYSHCIIFVSSIAIVITDGEQTIHREDYTPLPEASQGLKDKNVILYSLGIGKNINQGQLNVIVSSKNNVFTAASFSDLKAQTIVQNSCLGRANSSQ